MGAPAAFSTLFKGKSFCDFLIAFLYVKPFLKRINMLTGNRFSLLRVEDNGCKTLSFSFASPSGVCITLKDVQG